MTRLKSRDIADISGELDRYNMDLIRKTGRSLRGIACHAAGVRESVIQDRLASIRLGVVPISGRQGKIKGFAGTVGQIAGYMGFDVFVSPHSDVVGMALAVEEKADIIMMADDNRFVAIHLKHCRVIGNAVSTAWGFTAGIDLMSGGLKGRRCLVIGCGSVGRNAAAALIHLGAEVSVFDINRDRSVVLGDRMNRAFHVNVHRMDSLVSGLKTHGIIFDATNSGGIINEDDVTPETFVAAPGMPLGLTPTAQAKVADRLLHDPLQIGVATMAIRAMMPRL